MLNLTEDQKQTFFSIFTFLVETFKIIMASLLSVFVPQKCTNHVDNLCTLYDNFFDLTEYNKVVLGINFTTLFGFLILYIIEFKREKWCIDYLDIDENIPNNNLKEEIENYPEYKEKLLELNNYYYKASIFMVFINFVNFITSAILIYYYFLDYRSVTTLITNILLIIDKLVNSLSISYKSLNEKLALSAYIKSTAFFNTIDSDYKINTQKNINIKDQKVIDLNNLSDQKEKKIFSTKSKIQKLIDNYTLNYNKINYNKINYNKIKK